MIENFFLVDLIWFIPKEQEGLLEHIRWGRYDLALHHACALQLYDFLNIFLRHRHIFNLNLSSRLNGKTALQTLEDYCVDRKNPGYLNLRSYMGSLYAHIVTCDNALYLKPDDYVLCDKDFFYNKIGCVGIGADFFIASFNHVSRNSFVGRVSSLDDLESKKAQHLKDAIASVYSPASTVIVIGGWRNDAISERTYFILEKIFNQLNYNRRDLSRCFRGRKSYSPCFDITSGMISQKPIEYYPHSHEIFELPEAQEESSECSSQSHLGKRKFSS